VPSFHGIEFDSAENPEIAEFNGYGLVARYDLGATKRSI
jgi:hypothetical protein